MLHMWESYKECQLKGMILLERKNKPTHFLFLLWQQLFNLSRTFLHLTFIIARCSVHSGKRRAWMLFLLCLIFIFDMRSGSMDKMKWLWIFSEQINTCETGHPSANWLWGNLLCELSLTSFSFIFLKMTQRK